MNRTTVIALATIAGLLIGVGAAVAVQLYYPTDEPSDNHNGDNGMNHMEPSMVDYEIVRTGTQT